MTETTTRAQTPPALSEQNKMFTIAGYRTGLPTQYLPHGLGAWFAIGALTQILVGGAGSLFSFWGIVHVALGPVALVLAMMSLVKYLVFGGILATFGWLLLRKSRRA